MTLYDELVARGLIAQVTEMCIRDRVRMDRLLSVIKDHETDEEMDQWKVWLKYFVTMGGGCLLYTSRCV